MGQVPSSITNTYILGTGCYKRMKDLMREHIDSSSKDMFNAGTEAVTKRLSDMLEEIRSGVEGQVEHVVSQVSGDYQSIVLDRNIFKALAASREAVRDLLYNADGRFKAVLEPNAGVAPSEPKDVVMGGVENDSPLGSAQVPVTPKPPRMFPFRRGSSMPPTPSTPASHTSTPGSHFLGGLGRLSLFSPVSTPSAAPPSTPTPAAAPVTPVKTEK